MPLSPLLCSLAYRAAPKAPISPATEGLVTFWPISLSKARSTASFKKVPPWTTMCLPRLLASVTRMTL